MAGGLIETLRDGVENLARIPRQIPERDPDLPILGQRVLNAFEILVVKSEAVEQPGTKVLVVGRIAKGPATGFNRPELRCDDVQGIALTEDQPRIGKRLQEAAGHPGKRGVFRQQRFLFAVYKEVLLQTAPIPGHQLLPFAGIDISVECAHLPDPVRVGKRHDEDEATQDW